MSGLSIRYVTASLVLVILSAGAACSAPAGAEDPVADSTGTSTEGRASASAESKSSLGVSEWGTSAGDKNQSSLTGYGADGEPVQQFSFARMVDKDGKAFARIECTLPEAAILDFRPIEGGKKIQILQDTFRDHPEARKALGLAAEDLKKTGGSGSLVATAFGVHPLDSDLTSGNQEKLICVDDDGNACEKPPSTGSTVRDCALAAGGAAGLGCLASGAETLGIGCVVSAVAALGGGVICYDDIDQRSSCSCVTPCEDSCIRKYNKQYACPSSNTKPCDDAVNADRANQSACVKACPK